MLLFGAKQVEVRASSSETTWH